MVDVEVVAKHSFEKNKSPKRIKMITVEKFFIFFISF